MKQSRQKVVNEIGIPEDGFGQILFIIFFKILKSFSIWSVNSGLEFVLQMIEDFFLKKINKQSRDF